MQGRPTTEDYTTEHEKMIIEKPDHVLKSIVPTNKEDAQAFLGAANKVDARTDVKEHFVKQARRLA